MRRVSNILLYLIDDVKEGVKMNEELPNDGHSTLLRIIAGFLAFGGIASTITIATFCWIDSYIPSITTAWVGFVIAPFGAYLFGHSAFTGRLPKRFEKIKPQTPKTF